MTQRIHIVPEVARGIMESVRAQQARANEAGEQMVAAFGVVNQTSEGAMNSAAQDLEVAMKATREGLDETVKRLDIAVEEAIAEAMRLDARGSASMPG